jgi:hypothetical protein
MFVYLRRLLSVRIHLRRKKDGYFLSAQIIFALHCLPSPAICFMWGRAALLHCLNCLTRLGSIPLLLCRRLRGTLPQLAALVSFDRPRLSPVSTDAWGLRLGLCSGLCLRPKLGAFT